MKTEIPDAADAALDTALELSSGRSCPPDLAAQVLARQDGPRPAPAPHPSGRRVFALLWAAAAVCVFGVLVYATPRGDGDGRSQAAGPLPDPAPVVRDAAEVRALPASTTAVWGQGLDAAALRGLSRLTDLRSLRLSPKEHLGLADLPADAVEALGQLAGLSELSCQRLRFADRLPTLRTLGRLRRLRFSACHFAAEGLQLLEHLPNLRHLELRYCRDVTDASLRLIRRLSPHLVELHIVGTAGLSSAELGRLAGLRQLRHLDLSFCNARGPAEMLSGKNSKPDLGVNSTVLAALARLAGLESLGLYGCNNVHDSSLEALSECKQLRRVDLGLTYVQGQGLRHLPAGITALGINPVDSFEDLLHFKSLRHLSLRRPIGRAVQLLEILGTLPWAEKLHTLELRGPTGMEPAVLRALGRFPHLERLDISDCLGLDGEGLQILATTLPRLRELDLSHAQGLRYEDLSALKGARKLERVYLEHLAQPGLPQRPPVGLREALPRLRLREVRAPWGGLRR